MKDLDTDFEPMALPGDEQYEGQQQDGQAGDEQESNELDAAEKVINALRYYKKYAKAKHRRQIHAIRSLVEEDRALLIGSSQEHWKRVRECIEQNQKLFEMMISCAVNMLGDPFRTASNISQLRPASEHYMAKTKSVLKQIVRDWSQEGENERESCYRFVLEEIQRIFPNVESRSSVHVLVTGAGLARLQWELLRLGFSVQGNEFSIFMLIASNFVLNSCRTVDEFTIYPYLLDLSNSWSWEDQLRPVKFPDVTPSAGPPKNGESSASFSMAAGDFMQAYADTNAQFDAIVSVFFLDTAVHPLQYIRLCHRILKPNGVWLNFGPLTYHHEDADDVLSLELPFDQITRLLEPCGFRPDSVLGKGQLQPAKYTWNADSMLQYTYNCGYFRCTKLENN